MGVKSAKLKLLSQLVNRNFQKERLKEVGCLDSGNSPSRPYTVWKLHHNRFAFRTDLAFGR
jgi:hypothetical protein